MADQVVATDSAEAAATPARGLLQPANDPSQATDDGKGAAPATPTGFDEEWLKTLDPASRQTFEEKFVPKAVFTQKTQALAEDRKKFEAERRRSSSWPERPSPDRPAAPTGPTAEDVKRKELQDLAAAGDGAAMQQLVQMEAERQIQPIRTQVALQNAAQTARAANPYVV